jgi:hypothetical protein
MTAAPAYLMDAETVGILMQDYRAIFACVLATIELNSLIQYGSEFRYLSCLVPQNLTSMHPIASPSNETSP